jgi:hypothetical protein
VNIEIQDHRRGLREFMNYFVTQPNQHVPYRRVTDSVHYCTPAEVAEAVVRRKNCRVAPTHMGLIRAPPSCYFELWSLIDCL